MYSRGWRESIYWSIWSPLQKVLSSANLLALDAELFSRSFLFGTSICVDSINEKLLLQVIETITTSLSDFVNVELLPVNPSPLLQDYILCHYSSDEIVLSMAYCERVSTVPPNSIFQIGLSISFQNEAAFACASQSSPFTCCSYVSRQRSTDFVLRIPIETPIIGSSSPLCQLISHQHSLHTRSLFRFGWERLFLCRL